MHITGVNDPQKQEVANKAGVNQKRTRMTIVG